MSNDEKIKKLEKLVSPEGFRDEVIQSDEIWRSDPELFDMIFSRMNACTLQLIDALRTQSSKWKLKAILKTHLRGFRRYNLDTEDAEFITECFELLAHIVGVKIGSSLFRWLYGIPLWVIYGTFRFFRPERVINTATYTCGNCNHEFEIQVLQKGATVHDSWVIGKCHSCGDYNLLGTIPYARRLVYKNFGPVEYLDKSEFSEEQAMTRLEQIRYWRK